MQKIEHIGIAVSDIDTSNKVFEKIFGKENYKSEKIELEGVITSFFQIGENKIELVAATNSDSPISKFLSKNREGMHHIAFAVDNIQAEMERLKNEGITLLNDAPKKGADNESIFETSFYFINSCIINLCVRTRS